MANGQSYIADLQRWAGGNKQKFEMLGRQAVQELVYRMQNNSMPPVGPNVVTANFVNSWQPSINVLPPRRAGAGGDEVELATKDYDQELGIVLNSMKLGDIFYYSNSAAYGMRLNYGFTGVDSLGRHYSQRGLFFLEKTLATWPRIVAYVAADLKMQP